MKDSDFENAINFRNSFDPISKWINKSRKYLRGMFHYITADKNMRALILYYRNSRSQHELMNMLRGSVTKQYEFLKNPPPYVIERYWFPSSPGSLCVDALSIITNAQIPVVDTLRVMSKEYLIFANEQDYQTALTTIQIMKD